MGVSWKDVVTVLSALLWIEEEETVSAPGLLRITWIMDYLPSVIYGVNDL